MPVYVPPPREYAFRMMKIMGHIPISLVVDRASVHAPVITSGSWVKRPTIAAAIMRKWVATNVRKIGTRTVTLSLTPRRLRMIKTTSASTFIMKAFRCQSAGSRLKIWSTPDETEIEIVRM